MGALLYTWFIGTEDGTYGMHAVGWLIYSRTSVWGKRFRVTVLPFYHASVGLGKPRITYCLEHFSYAITLTTALYYEWRYDALCALSYISQSICTVCILWLTWAHFFHLLKNCHTGLGRRAPAVGTTAISNFCLSLFKLHRLASSTSNIRSRCQKEHKVKDNVSSTIARYVNAWLVCACVTV